MDASAGTVPACQQLIQVLDSQEDLDAIPSQPKDCMTQRQRDALILLARHFLESQAMGHDARDGENHEGQQADTGENSGTEESGGFGAGCLYFLGDLLTPTSLSHNHTASGSYHDQAFAHLRELGLKEKAIKTGTQDLGRGVRRLLDEPFRSAKRGREKEGAVQV